MQLKYEDYIAMERQLSNFRIWNTHETQRFNMTQAPFYSSADLFITSGFPCHELNPHLVLKIVDELIWCGLNPLKKEVKNEDI